MTTISLLRHGEVVGGQRFRGSTNDPLTPRGLEQMRTATRKPFASDLVMSSPLQRCADFAKEFAKKYSLPLYMEPQFSEMNFGDWEGCTTNEVYVKAPKALELFWSDPDKFPPPNGERLTQFQDRVLRSWDQVVKQYHDRHSLIVTHGGVIRILLCHLQNIELSRLMELEVGYGALFTFTLDRKKHDKKASFVLRTQI
jgi:broad specificity phosphatase PhoE